MRLASAVNSRCGILAGLSSNLSATSRHHTNINRRAIADRCGMLQGWGGFNPSALRKTVVMDTRKNWKLADELNIYQIILLLSDYDPSEFEGGDFDRWHNDVKKRTSPLRVAIENAAISGKLKANITRYDNSDDNRIYWNSTRIDIESLREWLISKNFGSNFFHDDDSTISGFADKDSPFFAPKLAAAVRAWIEVTGDADLLKNKTPKQALEKWLREHASEYGLTLENGNPNKQGIAEICKIANWKPEGGATPTATTSKSESRPNGNSMPGGRSLRSKPPTRSAKPARDASDMDDSIPF